MAVDELVVDEDSTDLNKLHIDSVEDELIRQIECERNGHQHPKEIVRHYHLGANNVLMYCSGCRSFYYRLPTPCEIQTFVENLRVPIII